MNLPARSLLAAALLGLSASVAAPIFAAAPAAAQQTTLFRGFDLDSRDPIQVEADALEVNDNAETKIRVSRFSGSVVVTRGNTLIKAAELNIFSPVAAGDAAEALNNEAFDRIEASGDISISAGDQTATGDAMVLDMLTRIATITGDVILTDGANVLSGNRLAINLDTGQANMQNTGGRVRVLIPGAGAAAPR